MQYTYMYNGDSHTIEITRQADGSLSATIGDQTYSVKGSEIANGGWLIDVDGIRTIAQVAAAGDERYVHLDGQHYTLEKSDPRRKRQSGAARSGDLTAQMPGQIIDVRVQVGDNVEVGDVLVVLEAMKMEIRVAATQAGRVDDVQVAVGDVVERGQTLVEVREN